MAGRLYEVNAGVDTIVDELEAVDAIFLLEIRVEASFNIIDDGLPAACRSRIQN